MVFRETFMISQADVTLTVVMQYGFRTKSCTIFPSVLFNTSSRSEAEILYDMSGFSIIKICLYL